MKEMYKGKVNSPATLLVETIDSSVTSIKVADGTVFPEGPNVAVIGTDGNAETIKYESINGNILVGCVRGFQGKASVWDKDTIIARNFTEYDLNALQENILELDKKELKDFQEDENHRTVTDSEKNKLANIEDGANKVTKISQLTNDKNFKTESEIQELINNSTKLKKEVVTSLPSTGKDDIIYLLKNKNDTNNYYTEYMWIGGKWEIIGDTKVDLTDYAKKSDIKTKLSEMIGDSTHKTVTDTEKKTWNNKVDKIEGKGLSTNDFTDELKNQLSNLSVIASDIDSDGIYKTVEYRDKSNNLLFKTVLLGSSPYKQIKLTAYSNGSTIKAQTWNLSYDSNDFIYRKEIQ